jgi:hypothetical protein
VLLRPEKFDGDLASIRSVRWVAFPSSEDVVLELRSDPQPKSIRNDHDLILDEGAVNITAW